MKDVQPLFQGLYIFPFCLREYIAEIFLSLKSPTRDLVQLFYLTCEETRTQPGEEAYPQLGGAPSGTDPTSLPIPVHF